MAGYASIYAKAVGESALQSKYIEDSRGYITGAAMSYVKGTDVFNLITTGPKGGRLRDFRHIPLQILSGDAGFLQVTTYMYFSNSTSNTFTVTDNGTLTNTTNLNTEDINKVSSIGHYTGTVAAIDSGEQDTILSVFSINKESGKHVEAFNYATQAELLEGATHYQTLPANATILLRTVVTSDSVTQITAGGLSRLSYEEG